MGTDNELKQPMFLILTLRKKINTPYSTAEIIPFN